MFVRESLFKNLYFFQGGNHKFDSISIKQSSIFWHVITYNAFVAYFKKILIDNLPSWMKLHSFVKYSLTWKNWTKQYANKLPKNHEIVKIDCCVTFLYLTVRTGFLRFQKGNIYVLIIGVIYILVSSNSIVNF